MKHLNEIRQKLSKGIPVIGTHIKTNDSTIVEFFGMAGFDFVWLDGEHPAMNIETVQRHTIAAQGCGIAAFYRVPWNDPILAKPALDMGVDGIIFPMIRTVSDAEKAVSACRYPPKGIRGWGPIRDNGYGLFDSEWQKKNSENTWRIMQIEHIEAVENLEKIIAVEGVDAITVGCSDLSASMGLAGHPEHPDVIRQLDILGAKCRAARIPFSVSANFDPGFIRAWINRGIDWLVVGGEYDFMRMGLSSTFDQINTWFEERN